MKHLASQLHSDSSALARPHWASLVIVLAWFPQTAKRCKERLITDHCDPGSLIVAHSCLGRRGTPICLLFLTCIISVMFISFLHFGFPMGQGSQSPSHAPLFDPSSMCAFAPHGMPAFPKPKDPPRSEPKNGGR